MQIFARAPLYLVALVLIGRALVAVYSRRQTVVSATFLFRIARSSTRGRNGNAETDRANDNGSQGG